MNFLKKHWTWISGFIVVLANYCVPAIAAILTQELGAHAAFKAGAISFLMWLGQVSPSPFVSTVAQAFKKAASLPVVLTIALLIVGCTAATWIAVVQGLIPIATSTALAVLQFSDNTKGGALTAAQSAAIDQYAQDAQTVLGDIGQEVASVSAATTNAAKIQTLLANLATQSRSLVPSLNLSASQTQAAAAINQLVTALLQDAGDIAGIVPQVNGSPTSSIAEASRVTGWPAEDFQLVSAPGAKNAVLVTASEEKLRKLQRTFVARHNALLKFRTGNAAVDKALASLPKQHGPSWIASLAHGERP